MGEVPAGSDEIWILSVIADYNDDVDLRGRVRAHSLATRRVPSLPPEPLKRLGGGVVRSAIMAVERADEDGRRAPLPARVGAALPRLFGMEIGTR